MKDNIWDIFEFTEYEVQIPEQSRSLKNPEWIPSSTPVSERSYVSIYLRQDDQKRLYKREEYDALTFLSDLGGLLEILLLLGMLLSSSFVMRLFYAALVKKTYRI